MSPNQSSSGRFLELVGIAIVVISLGAILHGFYHLAACIPGFGAPALCPL